MKKLFAILLVLAMLIPMGVVAQAEEVGRKPYYLLTRMNVDYDPDYPYVVTNSPFFWAPDFKEGSDELKVSNTPEETKEYFDEMPDGTRYIDMFAIHLALHQKVEDVVYMHKGVEIYKEWFDGWLKEYKEIGGKIDVVGVDLEYFNGSSYYISQSIKTDPTIIQRIVSNPRYETEIRPMLVERGFKFYENVTEDTPELFSIYSKSGSEYAQSRAIWDNVMRIRYNAYIDEAMEPLHRYYPDAVYNDYECRTNLTWNKSLDQYGNVESLGGNTNHAGDSSTLEIYNTRPATSIFKNEFNEKVYPDILGYNKAEFAETPYNSFMWHVNEAKQVERASEGDFSVFMTQYLYNRKNVNSSSNNAYYTEIYYHVGLLDPHPFYGYYISSEVVREDGDPYDAVKVANDIMTELTNLGGYTDREPIRTAVDWNSDYILSGMYANGRNLWRITPNTDVVSVEDFKVEGTDPTFSVSGKTVTFPGGKIIADSEVSFVGSCGYWVETPKDVTPVITRVDDIYRVYPSFMEDFEKYEAGSEFNYDNAIPEAVWQFKKTGKITSVVQADAANADNNVLAVTGTYTLRNVVMPSRITAGDDYAKNQAWEVQVTIPEDMAADAEILLLNCVGQKKSVEDLGVKIAGGKLYYNNAGEYQEMKDVSLSAGTYTIVREVDFTKEGAFNSDYTVYDATGKQLGQVKDVPMADLALPVTTVTIGCSKVAGEPVLFDNYKLYPTQCTAGFELYDAKLGMQVTELDKARDADTAYRVAWMNASLEEKSYTVMAAYYNGDTLVEEKVVEELKLAPGTDGVNTGVVKNETEGQTLLVYLKDNNSKDSDDASAKPGDGILGDIDNMLIYIIAGAVVLIIAVVVIILVASKKKKKKADDTPAAE